MPKGQTKRHRTGARPSQSVYALQPAKTRKRSTSATKKEKLNEEKSYRQRIESAIRQKKMDIEEAEARALAAIKERRRAEKEIASFLPPLSRSIVRPAATKNNIDRAIEEEEAKEAELELKREERKLRAAEERRLFEMGQKAKKTRKNWIALEKKFGLEHRSFDKIKNEIYEEELAKGHNAGLAEALAHFQAIAKTDPYMRMMKEGKLTWADILNMENEERPKKNTKTAAPPITAIVATTYRPLESNVSILTKPTYTRRAPIKDEKKLMILGLPSETDKGKLDVRKLKRTIYGTMTGKEIFPSQPKELKEVIIGIKLAGAFELSKVGQEVYTVIGTGNKVSASITYPTKELAEQALAFAKSHPIKMKGLVVDVRPS